MNKITQPSTEQLKELLSKITTGEWRFAKSNCVINWPGEDEICNVRGWSRNAKADGTLISLSPTLAAEVIELRKENEYSIRQLNADTDILAKHREEIERLSRNNIVLETDTTKFLADNEKLRMDNKVLREHIKLILDDNYQLPAWKRKQLEALLTNTIKQ